MMTSSPGLSSAIIARTMPARHAGGDQHGQIEAELGLQIGGEPFAQRGDALRDGVAVAAASGLLRSPPAEPRAGMGKSGWPIERLIGSASLAARSKTLRMPEESTDRLREERNRSASFMACPGTNPPGYFLSLPPPPGLAPAAGLPPAPGLPAGAAEVLPPAAGACPLRQGCPAQPRRLQRPHPSS